MRDTIRYSITLFIICLVASGVLAFVNSLTAPRILAQKIAKEQIDLKAVLPQAQMLRPYSINGEVLYYEASDARRNILGYIAKAEGKGYSGTIETFFSMDKKGDILAIKVSSHNETPGLGAKIVEDEFQDNFKDKELTELNDIEGIAGATISSEAVIDSVKQKAEEILLVIDE